MRHVLALAPVGEIAADQPDDPMLVLAHQQVECLAVALLHAPDQFVVELTLLGSLGRLNFGHALPALLHVSRPKPGNGTTRSPGKFTRKPKWGCIDGNPMRPG